MKKFIRHALVGALIAIGISACVVRPAPQPRIQYRPEEHPAYLHALSDLRAARWLVTHRAAENYAMSEDEGLAITEINAAIGEIKHAAMDDGKDIDEHPPIDARLNRSGRLHQAVELLHKVHSDIAREEDDSRARGLQHRALQHVDVAMHAVERALADIDR